MRIVAALGCSALLVLSACGSDTRQVIGTTPSTTATSVAAPPASTTASVVATTPPPTTAAPASTTPVSVAATTTTAKPQAATTTTVAPTTTVSSPATTEYADAPSPVVPGATHSVPADNSHPDGVYYATVLASGDPPPAAGSVVFEIVQLFTGNDCTAHFGTTNPDACVNDYGVETDPTQTIEVPLTDQYITVVDAATQHSYKVTGPELYKLIQGDAPSAHAPTGYSYAGFGFLVTFSGGKVSRLEQWWTP